MILGMIAWCQWMVLISKSLDLICVRETGPDSGSVPSSKDRDSDGDIMWINGPFACGLFNDLAIFCMGIKQQLGEKEQVEADDGYSGDNPIHIKTRSWVYYLEGGVITFEILFMQYMRL
jgi:hypothetical protein